MANLDTREKRASSIAICLYSMGPSIQAGFSGLDSEDRQMAGYGYSAIAASGAVAVEARSRILLHATTHLLAAVHR